MTRPGKLNLPLRSGVSASAVYCPPGAWRSTAAFLAERLPLVSDWPARIARGDVLDDQGRTLIDDRYRAQRRLYYWRAVEAEPEIPFHERIVFEDEHLLVADKPHFLPVVPGGRYVQQTLLARLRRSTGLDDLSPIHRLDRETAGLVVFSKRPEERAAYQNLFRDRLVDKRYECIAPDGTVPEVARHRLVEREGEAFMQMQAVDGAPNAETAMARLQGLAGGLARYALHPRTGLKHQLRAQMNALGLPILGDRIYPVLQAFEATPCFDAPLQLWAESIAFIDPLSGMPRQFSR